MTGWLTGYRLSFTAHIINTLYIDTVERMCDVVYVVLVKCL